MNREEISAAVGGISARYVQEAADHCPACGAAVFFKRPFGKAALAAVFALCLCLGCLRVFSPFGGTMAVTAHAQGTGQALTAAGAVMQTGSISDSGEMHGKPLFFYLSGKASTTSASPAKTNSSALWTGQSSGMRLAWPGISPSPTGRTSASTTTCSSIGCRCHQSGSG